MTERIAAALLPPWDEAKCRVCGWPLDANGQFCRRRVVDGQLVSDCSMRPLPSRRADARPDLTTLDGCRLFEDALVKRGKFGLYLSYILRHGGHESYDACVAAGMNSVDSPVIFTLTRALPERRVTALSLGARRGRPMKWRDVLIATALAAGCIGMAAWVLHDDLAAARPKRLPVVAGPCKTVEELLPEYDPATKFGYIRTGKGKAGHLLDGRAWQEFPEVRQ